MVVEGKGEKKKESQDTETRHRDRETRAGGRGHGDEQIRWLVRHIWAEKEIWGNVGAKCHCMISPSQRQ